MKSLLSLQKGLVLSIELFRVIILLKNLVGLWYFVEGEGRSFHSKGIIVKDLPQPKSYTIIPMIYLLGICVLLSP